MNMTCRVLLTFVLLATFDCPTAGKLITKPENTDIKVNDSTYFNCSTDIGSTAIFWFHETNYVYIGDAILDPYRTTGRFQIDKNEWNGTYIYNLVIHSVQPGDAGEYICSDDEVYGEKYSVQLVVLEDDPICRSNIELDEVIGQNSCNIEPDEVELECSVTYHGNVPPQMDWKKVGVNSSTPLEVSVVTSRNHFVSTLKLKGDIALNNSSYVCETKRTTQEPIKCISESIKILYALSIDSTVNKTIDDEIHCNANTSQSCSYKWKWLQDSDFTIESSTAVLTARKLGWHRCEAECYLRNQTCNLLVVRSMIAGHVYGESKSSPTGTIILSVVLAVVFTLIVVGVLIFVFIWTFRKRRIRLAASRDAAHNEALQLLERQHLDTKRNSNASRNTVIPEEELQLSERPNLDEPDGILHISPVKLMQQFDESTTGNEVSPRDPMQNGQEKSEDDPLSLYEPPNELLSKSHEIGINFQFLVENIKSSRLIDLLHEKNCITDEEQDHLSNQPDNYFKNDALLQWMRTINFNQKKGLKVLECLHQDEQNLIADSLEKGGVFIKSKISKDLLNERQLYSSLTKSSSTNAEGPKEVETMVIERLNPPHGLSLSSIQPAISEIEDDDIVIAPYFHQEANGIVIWFWCQSKNGETNLKKMYESNTLLRKLITIFKEFFNDSVSSVSEKLDPNRPTIFLGDFAKNDTIYGLAILGQEVFIVRLLRSDIEVYDSMAFRLKRRMTVDGMKNPENLVSCSHNKCLYAFDWDYQGQNTSDLDNEGQIHAILRIDPIDGKIIKTWNIDGRGGRLSVASDTNLILNINYEAKLHEYTAKGELIRTINLEPMCTGINRSWHAVKLDNGQFVVCHGGEEDPLSRVCLLSVISTSTMGRTDEVENILKSFGGKREESNDILWGPTYLSVDKEGSILVSDASHQTVLLSSSLTEPQIIVSEEHGLMESRTTCFDESTDQWFVADLKRVMVCRVKDKEVERKLYYLI